MHNKTVLAVLASTSTVIFHSWIFSPKKTSKSPKYLYLHLHPLHNLLVFSSNTFTDMAYFVDTGNYPRSYSQTTPLTRIEDTPQPISRTLAAIKKLQTDFDDFHAWMKSANKALSLIPAPIPKAVILYDVPTPPVLDSVKDKYPVAHETASWPSTSTSQYLHPPPPISKGGVNKNGLLTERQYDDPDPDLIPRIHSSLIMDITTMDPLDGNLLSYCSSFSESIN
jgi:hypothetical protein